MPATCEYRYEAMSTDPEGESAEWVEVTEELVRETLARETPFTRDLDDILIDMRTNGTEADCDFLVFRAVPVSPEPGLRVVYTTAPEAYDGFGTRTLVEVAGTDRRGRTIRKVGIRPNSWEWQTQRYGSGMYAAVGESEIEKFADIWTMTE